MGRNVVDDETLQQALDLVTYHGGSSKVACKYTDIPESTLRGRYDLAKKKGLTATTSPVGELPEGLTLRGTTTLYDDKGNVRLTWVKTKKDKDREMAQILAIVEGLKSEIPQAKKIPLDTKKYNKSLMNVIPIGDAHLGSYIWGLETGDRDFDLEIASKDLKTGIKYLVEHSPNCDRCLIINLGDFMHYSTVAGTTTKGTILDTDSRMAKMIQVAVECLRQAIETALEKHRQVEVINSVGNHDEALALVLPVLLKHTYEKNPRVIIRDEPTPRHYTRFGKVLIGVIHGDRIKEDKLPLLMASEMPEDWGATRYRYMMRGHYHHHKVTEYNGCQVEMFRCLSPRDAFANVGGWLSGQDINNITFHKEYGEISRMTANLDFLRDL